MTTANASLTPRVKPRWQFSLAQLLVWMAALGVVLWMLRGAWLAITGAGEMARHSACRGHCKQLVLALHFYHDEYGTFPPAYIADATGKPMHSWRVLILPYLEQQALYARYDFNEPWNGPNNILLASEMPRTFCCPAHESERNHGETNYVAIVGAATAWPGAKCVSLKDITDDQDETLLFVETHHTGICWLEPRDLDVASLPRMLNPPGKPGISSQHRHGPNAATVSGMARVFDGRDLKSDRVDALLTIAGGD